MNIDADERLSRWSRRQALTALFGAGAGVGVVGPAAWAQAGSSAPPDSDKPLRIVVPNAAGGGADLTARTVAQALSPWLGQPVIIDNKPSAGGVVAGELVIRAAPDGNTLLLVSSGTAVSAATFKRQPFDPLRDFVAVSPLATFDLVLVSAHGGRFAQFSDWLKAAQSPSGQLNLGTPQPGTTQHLAAVWLQRLGGLAGLQIVPFNGTPAALTALRGGTVDTCLDILGPMLPQVQSGALQPLAVLGSQRSAPWPSAPTVREASAGTSVADSLATFEVRSWNGLAAPAQTPMARVQTLHRAIQQVLSQPDVQSRLRAQALQPWLGSANELQATLAHDVLRWKGVVKSANLPLL